MDIALYAPRCFLCRRRLRPDKPNHYRVVLRSRQDLSDLSDVTPTWNEKNVIRQDMRLQYGTVAVGETIRASQVKLMERQQIIYLIHTTCKDLIQRVTPPLGLGVLLNMLISSTAPEHVDDPSISAIDWALFSRCTSRTEALMPESAPQSLESRLARLPKEIQLLILRLMPKDIGYWWGLHLGFDNLCVDTSARRGVLVALEISEALRNMTRDEDLIDKDIHEEVMMDETMRASVTVMAEGKYLRRLWNLDSAGSLETPSNYNVSEILDLDFSQTTFIAYKITDLGIIDIACRLDQEGQPLWVLKSCIRNHRVCYHRSAETIKKVRITRNVHFHPVLGRVYLWLMLNQIYFCRSIDPIGQESVPRPAFSPNALSGFHAFITPTFPYGVDLPTSRSLEQERAFHQGFCLAQIIDLSQPKKIYLEYDRVFPKLAGIRNHETIGSVALEVDVNPATVRFLILKNALSENYTCLFIQVSPSALNARVFVY